MRRYEVEVTEYGNAKERKLFNNQVDAFKYANSLEQRTGVKIAEVDGESYILIAEREEERHVDHLIRHKWPEEKPEKGGQYLVRIISPSGSVYYSLRGYEDREWHSFGKYLTHWWDRPEVTE